VGGGNFASITPSTDKTNSLVALQNYGASKSRFAPQAPFVLANQINEAGAAPTSDLEDRELQPLLHVVSWGSLFSPPREVQL
jgi:hypothetical protein